MLAIDINCAIITCANKRRSAVNLIFANWGEKTVGDPGGSYCNNLYCEWSALTAAF